MRFENYVVHSLERLHQKVDLQGSILVKLCNAVTAQYLKTPTNAKSAKLEFKFPMESVEELDELEKKLASESFYNQLVIHILKHLFI